MKKWRLQVFKSLSGDNKYKFPKLSFNTIVENLRGEYGIDETCIKSDCEDLLTRRCPDFENHIFTYSIDNHGLFTIPSFKDAQNEQSTAFFEPCMRSLNFDEFYFLWTSMLMERSIIFVSQQQQKISSCILTLTGLLRPFFWVNPLIYFLPKKNFSLVEAPVPIIIGVLLSKEEFCRQIVERYKLDDDTIVIFLDEEGQGRLEYSPEIRKGFFTPDFNGQKNELEELYNQYYSRYGVQGIAKDIVYAEDKVHAKKIAEKIWEILKENIIDFIPLEPIICEDTNKNLITGQILAGIITDTKLIMDAGFVEKMCKSQIFSVFLEKIYS